jgi:hypothetical protein
MWLQQPLTLTSTGELTRRTTSGLLRINPMGPIESNWPNPRQANRVATATCGIFFISDVPTAGTGPPAREGSRPRK